MHGPVDPLDPPTWPGLASHRATVAPLPDLDVPPYVDVPPYDASPLSDAITLVDDATLGFAAWTAALASTVVAFAWSFGAVVAAGVLRALLR